MINIEEHIAVFTAVTKSTELKDFTFMIKVLIFCVQISKILTLLDYACLTPHKYLKKI